MKIWILAAALSVPVAGENSDHIRGEWSSVRGDVVQWVAKAELTRRK